MVQKINVVRQLAGLEDLLFGVGTVVQQRGGVPVTITRINAANMPFDETRNLAETVEDMDDAVILLNTYGDTLDSLAANMDHLLNIQEVAVIGNNGNAGRLEGQTLAQVRAGINAAQLEGSNLAAVRAGINAAQLEGSNLAAVRAGIDAVALEGETLAQVKEGGNAATLDGSNLAAVRAGIDAAALEGSDLAAVVLAATTTDATSATKGKIRIATDAEAKAGGRVTGSLTDVTTTPAQNAMGPGDLVAWGFVTVSGGTVSISSNSYGLVSGTMSTTHAAFTITVDKNVDKGFAELIFLSDNQAPSAINNTPWGYSVGLASGGTVARSKIRETKIATMNGTVTANFGQLTPGIDSSGALFTGFIRVYGTKL